MLAASAAKKRRAILSSSVTAAALTPKPSAAPTPKARNEVAAAARPALKPRASTPSTTETPPMLRAMAHLSLTKTGPGGTAPPQSPRHQHAHPKPPVKEKRPAGHAPAGGGTALLVACGSP